MTTREEFAKLYPGIEPPSWIDEVELLTEQEALAMARLGIEVHTDRIYSDGRAINERWEDSPINDVDFLWECGRTATDKLVCSICYIIK